MEGTAGRTENLIAGDLNLCFTALSLRDDNDHDIALFNSSLHMNNMPVKLTGDQSQYFRRSDEIDFKKSKCK